MITCILLSAGKSERFGSPKALARLSQNTVIHDLQEKLLQCPCDEIIVVLGADADLIEPSIFIHSRIHVVHNKDHNFGQISSVKIGCRLAHPSSKGLMLLPVDCPLVKASSITTVINHFKEYEPEVLIPTYQNKKGHPPIFHQHLKSAILNLPMDQGINSLFAHHPAQTIDIDDLGIIKSFNTPQEFEALKTISKQ